MLITKTELDWQIGVDKALELKWSYVVERAIALAIHYFNTPVTDLLITEIQLRRSNTEDILRVTRFQDKGVRAENALLYLNQPPFLERFRTITNYYVHPRSICATIIQLSPDGQCFLIISIVGLIK